MHKLVTKLLPFIPHINIAFKKCTQSTKLNVVATPVLSLNSQNLNQNPRTLLPKFYGLYCIQSGGINIRLVVMNNVLPRSVKMHYKYDLKGSTYKRRASRKEREKACPTYKDLDFQDMHEEGLYFDAETYNNLMKTLQRDCRVGSFMDVLLTDWLWNGSRIMTGSSLLFPTTNKEV